MSGPRHVLVIGAQCPALGLLPELEQAARSLHDTLTAPWAGACEKDHPERTTLRCGADVTQAEVERAVREAGRHAAAEGAVLVVALLGHGTPGGTSLYFAAGDSEPENPTKMVDVGSLLSQLLDTPGLDGVIALVDTCYAGNAAPDLKSLAGGIREGDTRLALLMGAGAKEEAYELRFSRTLVKVCGEGIEGPARPSPRRPSRTPSGPTAARRARPSSVRNSTAPNSPRSGCGWPATPVTALPRVPCSDPWAPRNWPGPWNGWAATRTRPGCPIRPKSPACGTWTR